MKVAQGLVGIQFDGVWASPFEAGTQNGRTDCSRICERRPLKLGNPTFTDNLKEISLPLWEGVCLLLKQRKSSPHQFRVWRTDPANFAMEVPQGEGTISVLPRYERIYQQAEHFWQQLLSASMRVRPLLVVAHSAIQSGAG